MPVEGYDRAPNSAFASLYVNDDTGAVIASTTGGTFQDVLHASLMLAGPASAGGSLVVTPASGTIAVPAAKLGVYRFRAAGSVLAANAKLVQLRAALAGAAFASAKGAGAAARIQMAATAVESDFAIDHYLRVDVAGNVSLQVMAPTTADNVTFRRLQWSLELVEE